MAPKIQKEKDLEKFIKEFKEDKEFKEKDFKEKEHKEIKEKDKEKEKEKEKEHKEHKEKDLKDFKEKEHKEIKEFKEKEIKDFKEKDFKDFKEIEKLLENFPTDPGGPVESGNTMTQLAQRIANLEAILATGQSFIQPKERPAVGKKAAKKRAK